MGGKRYKKGEASPVSNEWRDAATEIKKISHSEIGVTQSELWEAVEPHFPCEHDTFIEFLKPRRQPTKIDEFFRCLAKTFAEKWQPALERPEKEAYYLSRLYSAYRRQRAEAFPEESLQKIAETHSKVAEILVLLAPFIEQAKRQGITEAALRAIMFKIEAQKHNAPIEDVLRYLESFVEASLSEKKARGLSSIETPDIAVLQTAARRFLDAGEIDSVSSPFDEEIERRQKARTERAVEEIGEDVRLIEEAANYDRLAFNIERVVERYLRAADLLFPNDAPEQFRYLGNKYRSNLKTGDANGNIAFLLVSIRLAREFVSRCDRVSSPLAWANFHSALGDALSSLGDREIRTSSLYEALAAYECALQEITQNSDPKTWSMIQNNIGLVLIELGNREKHGRKRYRQAVIAFDLALKERNSVSNPNDWAQTQHNLGTALWRSHQPKKAITAFQNALLVRTRENNLIGWAKTQDNLANVYEQRALIDERADQLAKVIAIRQEILAALHREDAPIQWALTQYNLGNSLLAAGARLSDLEIAELAIAAYREALKEITVERWLSKWFMIKYGVAKALLLFGENTARLEEAVDTLREALNKIPKECMPADQAGASELMLVMEKLLTERKRRMKV